MLGENKKGATPTPEAPTSAVGADNASSIVQETKEHASADHLEDGAGGAKYEQYREAGLSENDAAFLASFTPAQESAIYRKIDLRVVPLLSLLYLISHLDRANIGNAKIEGLEKSLGMAGSDYNVAVAVFFIPYILCEVPSNMILAKFKRPSQYVGLIVVCWGTVVTFTGMVQNLGSLCAARFLVGVFEAGFFPGSIWLISQWYPPQRTGGRNAFFYLSSAVSGAFSGLLAAGIAQMDGIGGYEAWRWIFIIEGIMSVVCGVVAFIFLPDTPSLSGRWLSPDERRFLKLMHWATRGDNRQAVDEGREKRHFSWAIVRQVVGDPHLYLQALIQASNTVPNNGFKFTMPQIIRNMGFTSTKAQLLSAPPYFSGAIAAVVASVWADKHSRRMPPILFFQALIVISMAVLFRYAPEIADQTALCYSMVVLACIGMYPIVPGCNAWTVNNLAGPEKRAFGVGFLITMTNVGGFIGSWIFVGNEAPEYPTGFGTCIAFAALGMCAASLVEYLYSRHNKKWEGVSREEVERMFSPEQLEKMGDRSPLFKYSL